MTQIKDLFRRLIGNLIRIYRRLPVRPFRGFLYKIYLKITPKMFDRNRIVLAEREGIKYELNLSELIDNSIYYGGYFEPMVTAIINKFVKPGMVVVDIGANSGCHTLRFAKLVGKNGKVIAFEPMSPVFFKLKRNLELNNFNNVIPEKIALSDINEGEKLIYFRSSWLLDKTSQDIIEEKKENINIITFDDYAERNKIKRIDFIKLDVDGYEYKVIKGAERSLRNFKPIMVFELGKVTLERYGNNLENLLRLLKSLGYSFYSERSLKQYLNERSLIESIPAGATINVLCKPKKIK